MKKFYITTPVYYVNGSPHIGHAYSSIICDVISRFYRLRNYDVFFLTGTDEHGQKISSVAERKKLPVDSFCSINSAEFLKMNKTLDISYNRFIRTSEGKHKTAVRVFWDTLVRKGEIYLSSYKGWYSTVDESFYTEKDIMKKDGKYFTKEGFPVEWVEEESYFFRLSKWRNKLLDFYNNNPNFILPASRMKEMRRFINEGLKDLSISRKNVKWGILVPGSEHVIYVWFDALINYLTGVGYPTLNNYWPVDLHIIGKDILKFHAVIWPAMLLAVGLPLPRKIFAHGWWKREGKKMSKSLGNVVSSSFLVEKYTSDGVRYSLLKGFTLGHDGSFCIQETKELINADLVNCFGNGVQRILKFAYNNFTRRIPDGKIMFESVFLDLKNYKKKYFVSMENLEFYYVLKEIKNFGDRLNKFIEEQEPWRMMKKDSIKTANVIFTCMECLRYIAFYLSPFVPTFSKKIFEHLNIDEKKRTFACLDISIVPNSSLFPPVPIFDRIL